MERKKNEEFQQIFLENLPLIDRIIRNRCRSARLKPDAAEDFRTEVYIHLMRDDYAALRKFENRSSLSTFLTVTIMRCMLDLQRKKGRWRPSRTACRLGATAQLIDRLVNKHHWGDEEAYRILKTNHRLPISRREFEETIALLPPRRPQIVIESCDGPGIRDLPAPVAESQSGAERFWSRLTAAMQAVVSGLGEEERLILRLRFQEGRTLTSIAATLGCEYKALWRRMNRILGNLRAGIERRGFDKEICQEMVGKSGRHSTQF